MKKSIAIVLTMILIIISISETNARSHTPYVSIYTSEIGLQVISYSKEWIEKEKLAQVYKELLSNVHGYEINNLKTIYIYPEAREGVDGYYNDDIRNDRSGNLYCGDKAYIEIFNGDKYNSIEKIGRVLSHEYGHHFTTYYLVKSEKKYYTDWYTTEYARLRKLEKPKTDVINHKWDIAEIAAEDYVELFGSKNAKTSYDFKDTNERLSNNIVEYSYTNRIFNLIPQENLEIPLATEIKGLYAYWIKLMGVTAMAEPKLYKKPNFISLTSSNSFISGKKYDVKWEEAVGKGPFEYTVVMYPIGNPAFPKPIKTVKSGESLEATFGTVIKRGADGAMYGILENFEGQYEFKIFIKDSDGFMYSSEPLQFNFDLNENR